MNEFVCDCGGFLMLVEGVLSCQRCSYSENLKEGVKK